MPLNRNHSTMATYSFDGPSFRLQNHGNQGAQTTSLMKRNDIS